MSHTPPRTHPGENANLRAASRKSLRRIWHLRFQPNTWKFNPRYPITWPRCKKAFEEAGGARSPCFAFNKMPELRQDGSPCIREPACGGTGAPYHDTDGKLKPSFSTDPFFLDQHVNAEQWSPRASTNPNLFVPWEHDNSFAFHKSKPAACWTLRNRDKIPY